MSDIQNEVLTSLKNIVNGLRANLESTKMIMEICEKADMVDLLNEYKELNKKIEQDILDTLADIDEIDAILDRDM